jgi:hypothetical protein
VGPVGDIWYNPADNGKPAAGAAVPIVLNARFFDKPGDSCHLVERNSLTGKDNFVREAQFEFHFCTVLAVRDPAGTFHQLLSFYWNMHWQSRFHPTNFAAPAGSPWSITQIAGGNSSAVSHIIKGEVTDKRFKNLITAALGQSCNQVFAAAETTVEHPGPGRRESREWANFDVRR